MNRESSARTARRTYLVFELRHSLLDPGVQPGVRQAFLERVDAARVELLPGVAAQLEPAPPPATAPAGTGGRS